MESEIAWGPSVEAQGVFAVPGAPPRAAVLLCHGLMSNRESGTNRALTERLCAHRVATLRFHFVGHGDGSPLADLTLTRCLDQVNGALAWLAKQGFAQIGLVGSSFGGLVAILAAARHPTLFAVGLKCPVSDYPPLWRSRLGEGGMRHWQESGLLTFAGPGGKARLGYAFYEDLLRYPTESAAQKIQSPTRIIHGDADPDVPVAQSLRLFSVLKSPKEICVIPGADHEFSRAEDFEQMIGGLTEWMLATRSA